MKFIELRFRENWEYTSFKTRPDKFIRVLDKFSTSTFPENEGFHKEIFNYSSYYFLYYFTMPVDYSLLELAKFK